MMTYIVEHFKYFGKGKCGTETHVGGLPRGGGSTNVFGLKDGYTITHLYSLVLSGFKASMTWWLRYGVEHLDVSILCSLAFLNPLGIGCIQ